MHRYKEIEDITGIIRKKKNNQKP